ncbi:MAG: type IV pilus modification PilV family protein [Candidatus Microsaccharimonas sp.]
MLVRNARRGDTLIEVLFAVTVFSLIVVGSLAIMNQGTSASRRALETTIARQGMDGQAETLRFLHASYVSEYQSGATYNTSDAATSPAEQYFMIIQHAKANPKTAASALSNGATSCPTNEPSGSFIVNPSTARLVTNATTMQPATIYPELVYNTAGVLTASRGLWVEAVRSATTTGATSNAGFIDFHIRACWMAQGSKVPVTLGTIVRLYEPRG